MAERTVINQAFPVYHCLCTVAAGPLLTSIINSWRDNEWGLPGLYFFFFVMGILLAIPFVVVYYRAFRLLIRKTSSVISIRIISSTIVVAGILLIMYLTGGYDPDILISYSLAAIASGMVIPVTRKSGIRSTQVSANMRLRQLLYLSILSFFLLAATQIISYFREPLLGLHNSVGGHNFGFNVGFYFPVMILSGLIAYFTAGHVVLGWKEFKSLKLKIIALAFSVPVVMFLLYYIFKSFNNH